MKSKASINPLDRKRKISTRTATGIPTAPPSAATPILPTDNAAVTTGSRADTCNFCLKVNPFQKWGSSCCIDLRAGLKNSSNHKVFAVSLNQPILSFNFSSLVGAHYLNPSNLSCTLSMFDCPLVLFTTMLTLCLNSSSKLCCITLPHASTSLSSLVAQNFREV